MPRAPISWIRGIRGLCKFLTYLFLLWVFFFFFFAAPFFSSSLRMLMVLSFFLLVVIIICGRVLVEGNESEMVRGYIYIYILVYNVCVCICVYTSNANALRCHITAKPAGSRMVRLESARLFQRTTMPLSCWTPSAITSKLYTTVPRRRRRPI